MTRETFHKSLTANEKLFFAELAAKLGKLKYEGEKAPKGYVVQDYQPHSNANRVTK